MAWYGYGYGFPRKLTVGERQAEARREAAKLEKKGHKLEPIRLQGRTIATTFWGEAWCDHLESLSDFANRLERGRSYVRNGSVIDLKLEPGCVRALVSGSEVYTITIDIEPLPMVRWKQLVRECSSEIGSVIALLSGKLPSAALERLCDPKTGIFPRAEQVELSCSCPDSSYSGLCKHLAAVLYGVGSRLDREPELLFVLRGVDKLDLVGAAAAGPLVHGKPKENELQGDELAGIFGIELVEAPASAAPARVARLKRKASPRKATKPKKRRAAARIGAVGVISPKGSARR